ncbi:MAG: SH3 domain-containing protein, partial [bacterium]
MKTICLLLNILWFASQAFGQNVGDKARLESTNPKGVPVHATATDIGFVRWVNGTLVKVVSIGGKWFHVSAEGKEGWVNKDNIF